MDSGTLVVMACPYKALVHEAVEQTSTVDLENVVPSTFSQELKVGFRCLLLAGVET
jgi:hypothetical protein